MADKAHLATDELLDKMERRLRAIYTRASHEIGEAWKAYLQESGAEIADLQRQYQEAKAANDTELARQIGKYYSQDGKVYRCTRDTGNPVYNALSELVGLYVEEA